MLDHYALPLLYPSSILQIRILFRSLPFSSVFCTLYTVHCTPDLRLRIMESGDILLVLNSWKIFFLVCTSLEWWLTWMVVTYALTSSGNSDVSNFEYLSFRFFSSNFVFAFSFTTKNENTKKKKCNESRVLKFLKNAYDFLLKKNSQWYFTVSKN